MPRKSSPPRVRALPFDVPAFLRSGGVSARVVRFTRAKVVYAQGTPANGVFYVQEGGVKLSVLSKSGKEAVVARWGRATSSAKDAWPGSRYEWARRLR